MSVTFQLPSGLKNLATLFPSVDTENVEEYYLELKNGSDVILTTNRFHRGPCCCEDEVMRVFFVNYLGGIDAINLRIMSIETDVKSSLWKKGLKYPLQKFDGGWQRTGVQAQVVVTAQTNDYTENEMEWLEELRTTPNAWIQWKGTQGQADDYLPIVVQDGKFLKRKDEERYNYPYQLVFTMSNEKIILRN